MTVQRLVLLRHGRTEWNAQRRFQGQADPSLDAVGRAQAYEVAALIAALQPVSVITSDAQRAAATAQVVADACGLPLHLEPRFRERSLGHWEGLTRDEVAQRYPDEFADWVAGRDVTRRGGETRQQVAERALAAFDEIDTATPADQGGSGTVVVVTHSATAMALTADLLGISQDVHVIGPLANCHWTELSHDPQWRLRAHNIGVPGVVAPLPVRLDGDDASDADA